MTNEGWRFAQIILSDDQLRAGLAADVDRVHIFSEDIAMTSLRAGELAALLGISFQKSFDELDERSVRGASVHGRLQRCAEGACMSPMAGVKICTDPAGHYSSRRLQAILNGLHLSRDPLVWVTLGIE